ncbi:hypothetical protein SDC9_54238 [bioreactor metagenome]|uniref:Transglycosylase SLT domain-containing protein n=1 Tax=bioreactor metagenome TaxID=1076179 RepID=A0A644WW64_9ZZZZ
MKRKTGHWLPVIIRRDVTYTVIVLTIWISASFFADALVPKKAEAGTGTAPRADYIATADKLVSAQLIDGEDQDESERIEEALEKQGYFRRDIPLPFDEQDLLHTACEEFGVSYELALAVIRQETNFRNVLGDDGESAGYMQVQERWHKERMDRLGAEDLLDPYDNFRVGCSFLAELIGRYGDLQDALTAYNSGHPGESEYSRSVLKYMEEYEQ